MHDTYGIYGKRNNRVGTASLTSTLLLSHSSRSYSIINSLINWMNVMWTKIKKCCCENPFSPVSTAKMLIDFNFVNGMMETEWFCGEICVTVRMIIFDVIIEYARQLYHNQNSYVTIPFTMVNGGGTVRAKRLYKILNDFIVLKYILMLELVSVVDNMEPTFISVTHSQIDTHTHAKKYIHKHTQVHGFET